MISTHTCLLWNGNMVKQCNISWTLLYIRPILSQFFHKLKNMDNCYNEFIFVIVERINMQTSTFCQFCDQKEELVILMYNTGLHVLVFSACRNLQSTCCKTHHSHTVYQNNIKFSFRIIWVTKCWNLRADTFNNNKYKFIVKVIHVFWLMEKLRQN